MQTDDGPKIKIPKDKIKAFNLMPITISIVPYLFELFPELQRGSYNAFEEFDYFKIEYGEIYFYTKRYIDSKSLWELKSEFLDTLLSRYGVE